MKKNNTFFIVTAIIGILGGLYAIITSPTMANALLESAKVTYSSFPAEFQERIVETLSHNGVTMIVVESLIGIVLNSVMLYFGFKKQIFKKKGMFIAFSILTFFTSTSNIVEALALLNFIILLCTKKDEEDKKSSSKKERPYLKYERPNKTKIITAIVLLVLYFSQIPLSYILPEIRQIRMIANIIFDIVLLTVAIIFFFDELKSGFKLLKENFSSYIGFIFKNYGITMLIFVCVNLAVILITKRTTSVNQESLESLPMWYMAPTAIIWAPIVEEIVFRGVLRRLIKNDKVFIVVSAVIFGALHAMNEASILNIVLTTLPYSVLGAYLAYLYVKTNNISVNITAHSIHNTIATLLSLLA